MKAPRFLPILLFLAILPAWGGHPKGPAAVLLKVYDGDTVQVRWIPEGKETPKFGSGGGQVDKVRLIGIDAPEEWESDKLELDVKKTHRSADSIRMAGFKAGEKLRSLAPPGTEVFLEFDRERRDKYGRLLAYLWRKDGLMLNREMVRAGFAKAYQVKPNTRHLPEFWKLSRSAMKAKLGLWKDGGLEK